MFRLKQVTMYSLSLLLSSSFLAGCGITLDLNGLNGSPQSGKPNPKTPEPISMSGVFAGVKTHGTAMEHWQNHQPQKLHLKSLSYDPNWNLLPIQGSIGTYSGDLVVTIMDDSHLPWNYSIPVHHGKFGSTITVPYHGSITVSVGKADTHGGRFYGANKHDESMGFFNKQATLSPQKRGLLESWFVNYTENPKLHKIASQIVASVSRKDVKKSASEKRIDEMRTISNWVSEYIKYNSPLVLSGKTDWQQASHTFNTRVGVCQDETAVTASLLRSAKIPTRIIFGRGFSGTAWGAHDWNEAWNGKRWVTFDPTFDQVYLYSQEHKIERPASITDRFFNPSPALFKRFHKDGKTQPW